MRYVYNCVKLVLLIACLGFAGQTSAVKPVKLDYVEIGGLQFKLQENQLMFRFANDVQQYVKEDYKGAAFREANINIFLQAIDNNAVFEKVEEGTLKSEFRNCPLIRWMVQCDGSHVISKLSKKQTSKSNTFDASILCQNFANDLLQQLNTNDSRFEWIVDNYSFVLNKGKGFTVKLGSSKEIALNNYLGKNGSLTASCGCIHKKARIGNRDLQAFAFLDISNITGELTPLVKALTGYRTEEQEDDVEDFGGFGDLF